MRPHVMSRNTKEWKRSPEVVGQPAPSEIHFPKIEPIALKVAGFAMIKKIAADIKDIINFSS